MVTIEIGSPELTGKSANLQIQEVFGQVNFPITAEIQNHAPQDVCFPELGGLFLRHAAHSTDTLAAVVVQSLDDLQRAASSMEQIAQLNGWKHALTITASIKPAQKATVDPTAAQAKKSVRTAAE